MTFVGSGGDPTLEIKRRTWMKKKKGITHTHTKKQPLHQTRITFQIRRSIRPTATLPALLSLSLFLSFFLSLSIFWWVRFYFISLHLRSSLWARPALIFVVSFFFLWPKKAADLRFEIDPVDSATRHRDRRRIASILTSSSSATETLGARRPAGFFFSVFAFLFLFLFCFFLTKIILAHEIGGEPKPANPTDVTVCAA